MRRIILFFIISISTFSKFEDLYNVSILSKNILVSDQIGKVRLKEFNFYNSKELKQLLGTTRIIKYENSTKALIDFERIIKQSKTSDTYYHKYNKFIGLKENEYFIVLKNYNDINLIQYISNEKCWNNMKNYLINNNIETEQDILFVEKYIM